MMNLHIVSEIIVPNNMMLKIHFFFLLIFTLPVLAKCSAMYSLEDIRIEVLGYNESVLSDVNFKFGKINRTTSALNASVTLLEDILDQKSLVNMDVWRLAGMEYKKSGTVISMYLCKFFKNNVFGIRDMVMKAGNIDGCNFPKGRYYVTNFILVSDNFPKFVPLGSYKIYSRLVREDGAQIISLQWMLSVKRLIQQN